MRKAVIYVCAPASVLARQEARLRKRCHRENISVTAVYRDDGSGSGPSGRPGLAHLLEEVVRVPSPVVMTSVDSLMRGTGDVDRFMDMMITNGIRVRVLLDSALLD